MKVCPHTYIVIFSEEHSEKMYYRYGDGGHERAACRRTCLSIRFTLDPIDEVHDVYGGQNLNDSCIEALSDQELEKEPLLGHVAPFDKCIFVVGVFLEVVLDAIFESLQQMLYLHMLWKVSKLLELESLFLTALKERLCVAKRHSLE